MGKQRSWARDAARVTRNEVRQKERDVEHWLREYRDPDPLLRRSKPANTNASRVAPSVVMLNGAWHAYLQHGSKPAPVVGDTFECMHARTGRSGMARVLSVVWTQHGRSLVRVERV